MAGGRGRNSALGAKISHFQFPTGLGFYLYSAELKIERVCNTALERDLTQLRG